MSSIPISSEGFVLVKKELDQLKSERPEIIEAIAVARAEGDLKENAGYHGARERQGILEARINYIESRIPQYNVIDISKLDSERIIFGATVEVEDVNSGEEKTFTLLGPDETGYFKNSISILSPVARALVGKEEGDEVTVNVPKGKLEYEIISVTFGNPLIRKQ